MTDIQRKAAMKATLPEGDQPIAKRSHKKQASSRATGNIIRKIDLPLPRQEFESRFMSLVYPEPTSGCWFWMGDVDEKGYGRCYIGLKSFPAHRVSFSLFCHEITDRRLVCHRCDIYPCVNPDHLWLGTHSDNMLDCARKGRMSFGQKTGGAKLSLQDVRDIRSASGERGAVARLAAQYGVMPGTISRIRRGVRWSNLT